MFPTIYKVTGHEESLDHSCSYYVRFGHWVMVTWEEVDFRNENWFLLFLNTDPLLYLVYSRGPPTSVAWCTSVHVIASSRRSKRNGIQRYRVIGLEIINRASSLILWHSNARQSSDPAFHDVLWGDFSRFTGSFQANFCAISSLFLSNKWA